MYSQEVNQEYSVLSGIVYLVIPILFLQKFQDSELAQQVKIPSTESNDLSSILETHMVDFMYSVAYVCPHTQINVKVP